MKANVSTIGLNRFLYTFKTHESMVKKVSALKGQGTIEVVYLNNEYGFEFKPYTFITFSD